MGWNTSTFRNENDLCRKMIFTTGLMVCVAVFFLNSANSSARTAVEFHNFFERLVSFNRTKKFADVDESGGTVLHKAVKLFPILNETLDILKLHGVDFNALDKAGNSAFFNAVQHGRNASFLNTLINYGMDWKTRNKNNDTALHVAALYGNLPAVKLFISLESDVNAQNAIGRTPLHQAVLSTNVSQNTLSIVRFLWKYGANSRILDEHGKSAKQLACGMANTNRQSKKRIVSLLHLSNPKLKEILDEVEQLKSNTSKITKIIQIVQTEDLDTIKCVLSHVGKGTEITEIWDKKLHLLLHVAIKYRDFSVVEYLINSQGFAKKLKDPKFNSYLVELCLENMSTVCSATFEQKLKMLQLLISIQPDLIESIIEIVDNWGKTNKVTPLLYSLRHAFSNRKQFEMIQMLIENHANVNAKIPESNITALMLAAFGPPSYSRVPIIGILIKNDADVNAVNQWGYTFMHYAAEYNIPSVFHETVEYLDSINNSNSFLVRDHAGQTVLHVAVYYMEVLNRTLEIFKNRGVDFSAIDGGQNSVLFKAIVGGRSESFLKTLIAFGAGNTFLHTLATNSTPVLFDETVAFFDSTNNTDSFTIRNNGRETVLHLAVKNMKMKNETLDIFWKRRADFNELDLGGRSILFREIAKGSDYSFLENLISFGADWRLRDKDQNTVLHVAAAWGNLDALKFFSQLGAAVSARNSDGNTPLHLVFTYGFRFARLNFVCELISLGANVHISNNEGKLASDYARQRKIRYPWLNFVFGSLNHSTT